MPALNPGRALFSEKRPPALLYRALFSEERPPCPAQQGTAPEIAGRAPALPASGAPVFLQAQPPLGGVSERGERKIGGEGGARISAVVDGR